MKRRKFIAGLASAAAWPIAARGQQSRSRTVGILMAFPPSDGDIQVRVKTFLQELRHLGWSDAENIRVEQRWPSDNMDRVRSDAAELLMLKPEVILVSGRRAVAVLQEQTRSIPVVFAGIGDPVASGVVASFAHPSGNFTGFTLWEYSVVGKMLEMVLQIAPATVRTALIYNPDNPANFKTAKALGLEILPNLLAPADKVIE